MKICKKVHPLCIIEGIRIFIFLLIIPLIRGGIYYIINGDIYTWLDGAWADILVLMIIIGLSIIRWHNYEYTLDQNNFIIYSGIFFKKKKIIPKNNISHILIQIPFYYKFINAIRLKCDVFSGQKNHLDVDMIIRKKDYKFILNHFPNINVFMSSEKNVKKIKVSKTIYIAALSLLMSNTSAGIVFISAFISNAGKIIGNQFEEQLYGSFEQITKKLAFGFPPAGAAIAYILLIAWIIAFIRNWLKYIDFKINKSDKYIMTKGGLFTHSFEYFSLEKVNYIDVAQSIFTKIIGLCSIFFHVSGSGKNPRRLVAIIPATTKKDLISTLNMIVDGYNLNDNNSIFDMKVKPKRSSWFRYIKLPIYIFLLSLVVFIFLLYQYQNWRKFLIFVILMISIVCFWILIIKVIDVITNGISKNEDMYILRYADSFQMHTVLIFRNKVYKTEITQTAWQKLFNKCDLIIYSISTVPIKHKCKNVNFDEAVALLND